MCIPQTVSFIVLLKDTPSTEIYTLSLHDALPIFSQCGDQSRGPGRRPRLCNIDAREGRRAAPARGRSIPNLQRIGRSEEHTSELQSLRHLVCRLLLEKKKR